MDVSVLVRAVDDLYKFVLSSELTSPLAGRSLNAKGARISYFRQQAVLNYTLERERDIITVLRNHKIGLNSFRMLKLFRNLEIADKVDDDRKKTWGFFSSSWSCVYFETRALIIIMLHT